MYETKDEIIKTLLHFTERNKVQVIKFMINKEKLENRNLIFSRYIEALLKDRLNINMDNISEDIFFLNDSRYDKILIKTIYCEEHLKNKDIDKIIKNIDSVFNNKDNIFNNITIISFNGFNDKNKLNYENIKLVDMNELFYFINNIDRTHIKTYSVDRKRFKTQSDEEFDIKLEEFKTFYKDNINIKSKLLLEQNKQLYKWVCTQRYLFKTGKLSIEEINKLKEAKFIFDEREFAWNEYYEQLARFYEKYGVISVPNNDLKYNRLAKWVQRQRKYIRENKISIERKNKLIKLGIFDAIEANDTNKSTYRYANNEKWNKKLEEYKEYYKNRDKFVPIDEEKYKELYRWAYKQKIYYRKGKLSKERFEKLNKVGFVFDSNNYNWDRKYNELVKYYNNNKNIHIKCDDEANKELAMWIRRQRENLKLGRLSSERIKKLSAIGFDFNVRENTWNVKYNNLKLMYDGKKEFSCEEREALYKWIYNQKDKYSRGKLSQEKINKLIDIGVDMTIKGRKK